MKERITLTFIPAYEKCDDGIFPVVRYAATNLLYTGGGSSGGFIADEYAGSSQGILCTAEQSVETVEQALAEAASCVERLYESIRKAAGSNPDICLGMAPDRSEMH